MPWQPRSKLFTAWPREAVDVPARRIQQLYESGFAGALYSPNAVADFYAAMQEPDADAVVHQFGMAGAGAGKLVVPFLEVEKQFPGCWPGPAQGRGDCVSHSTKNGLLVTLACDVAAGTPDEKTGLPEEKPEVSERGVREGVLSTEAIYWWRRHGGDGWMCPEAARVAVRESGCWLRANYPDLNVDLTSYNARTAGLYGRNTPPANFLKVGQLHLAHEASEARSFEAVRDLLANGYGISTCGGEGYSSTRDENGVSSQRGSWAHAMACIGADDRDEIKQKYGEPLVLILNSWGRWNSGGRRILNTQIDIPEGSFWVKWSQARRREFIAFAGVAGWEKKEIDWSF